LCDLPPLAFVRAEIGLRKPDPNFPRQNPTFAFAFINQSSDVQVSHRHLHIPYQSFCVCCVSLSLHNKVRRHFGITTLSFAQLNPSASALATEKVLVILSSSVLTFSRKPTSILLLRLSRYIHTHTAFGIRDITPSSAANYIGTLRRSSLPNNRITTQSPTRRRRCLSRLERILYASKNTYTHIVDYLFRVSSSSSSRTQTQQEIFPHLNT
jgi:hypothetical protein